MSTDLDDLLLKYVYVQSMLAYRLLLLPKKL